MIGAIPVAFGVAVALALAGCSGGDRKGDGMDSRQTSRPGLVRATTDHGRAGYVRVADMNRPPPANPQEALKWNARSPRVIPVYASDGVTMVGKLTESSGPAEYASK
jgi:hypothetical protein